MARRALVIPPHGHRRWLGACFAFGAAGTPLIAWAAFPWWLVELSYPVQAVLLFGPGVLLIAATRRRCQHAWWHIAAAVALTAGQWIGGLTFVHPCRGGVCFGLVFQGFRFAPPLATIVRSFGATASCPF